MEGRFTGVIPSDGYVDMPGRKPTCRFQSVATLTRTQLPDCQPFPIRPGHLYAEGVYEG